MIVIPYILIAFLVLRDKAIFNRFFFKYLVIFVLTSIFIILSAYVDSTYANWLSFNSARSLIQDTNTKSNRDILSVDQKILLNGWWLQDEKILPSKKVIEAAPSYQKIIYNKIQNVELSNYIHHKFSYLIFFLLGTSFILVFLKHRNIYGMLYVIFSVGVLILLLVRDVDRVIIPIMLVWFYILFNNIGKTIYTSGFLIVFLVIFIYSIYPRFYNYDYNYEKSKLLKEEARVLLKKNQIYCEPSIQFLTSWYPTRELFRGNKLFDEKSWMSYKIKYLLPTGWPSRLDYFYKSHKISHNETKREYKNYYEFLISDKTGFIGGKKLIKSDYARTILRMYDKVYLEDKPNCYHEAVISHESMNFSIAQIKINCK